MTQERWKEIEAVFEQALELPLHQRLAFLQSSCDGDEELCREVQSLLDSHARAGSFIDQPGLFIVSDETERDKATVASGQLIGSYRVVRELGRGGMGTVYLAERADEQYQKTVAIKLIKRGMDTDAVLRRFRNEQQILASFDHANIARLFDAGTTVAGLPYFVMEYVEGVSIDKYCNAHALSVSDRLNLFREVCAAVAYAHRCGVIHRDIKSSNIVVTAEGVPKLVDFGIAKILQPADSSETLLTAADMRPMTPQYASPEQVRGESLTATTDIYSLGVVLYELLTGQLPYRFVSHSPHDVARAITEQEPTRPSTAVKERDSRFENRESVDSRFTKYDSRLLRGDLDNIVLKALRKEPEQRYQSVQQLSEDIRRHLERRPIIARPVRVPARVWRWSRRNPILAGAVTASLLLAVAVVWLLREQFIAPKAAVPDKSIAILPFEYLSGDKTDAYLADGIQEEILTRLSKVADLKVISRTSTQRFKSTPENLPEIARQLGVAHILEGSVQKASDQIRVNVQLVNAQTESHLWAEKFDRKLQDIFAVETDIATKIADTLQAKLSGREQHAITARPTENSEAYQLYLLGRHLWAQRGETALLKAIDYFNQAIAKDPSYARAYAGIADCYILLPFFSKQNPADCRAKAKSAATEALRIDSELADAHTSIGVLAANDLNFAEAKQQFLRAIDLDPNYAYAYAQYSRTVLEPLGQFDEAIAQMKRATELDPLSALYYANLAESYRMARRYSEAIAQARKAVELEPAFSFGYGVLGIALDLSGRRDEALAEYRKAYELSHDFHLLPLIGRAYALKGEREKALQLLHQLQELERQNSISNYGFALLYVSLGEKDEALNRLERSYQAGEALLIHRIKVDPLLDPLRGDPRFEKLANEVVAPETPAPAKSIAVLPFENLSRDPDNAFFTDGVQDEILTALTRIADLKVISRTSVAEYKSGIARDLHEIGLQLGVAHVLEGSVQRAGNGVRVNVQLVDTHTDAHIWAQTYDREVTDVFAIQSDIAKAIASQLQAKLSATEQTAIAQPPTADLTAFLLYNRAKSLVVLTTMSTGAEQKFIQAINLLNQAVARDPSFFLAYCQLAYSHDQLYFLGFDHTPARLALAEAAIQEALRLRPDAGEAHLARAENLYSGRLDYAGALVELDIARRTLPNDSRIFDLSGAIQARQGKYEESLRSLERAMQLDPRNLYILHHTAVRFNLLRRYAEGAAVLDHCLAINPSDADTRVARARLDLEWKADPRPLHKFIDSIRAENPGEVPNVADSWFACALAERDAGAAEAALDALGENSLGNDAVKLSRTFGEGLIARMTMDAAKARAAFTAARTEQEKHVQAQPDYGPALCILGLIDAGLGRKEDALREGRRAIELMPVEKDFTNGVHMIEHLAIIAAWVGEKDLACEQLAIATRLPGYVSYGQLKLLPCWDALRGDPRFEKIVASLAPR